MICPSCSFDNLEGADTCAACLMDLRALDEPRTEDSLEDSLMHEPVESLGPKTAVTVTPETTIRDALECMVENNIGCVLVVGEGKVVGIFSERDLLLRVAGRMDEVEDQPISRFMTVSPQMLEVGTPLAFALNRMSLNDFRHLPLTEDGGLLGIISLRDFLGLLFRSHPSLAATDA